MNNPLMLIGNLLRSGGNPQQMIMNIMQNSMPNNPMANNIIQMMNRNDKAGIEQMARNLCKSNGITPEQAIQEAKRMFKV